MSIQKRFADKVVIITGSSSGIGRDAAVEFAKEGASVVIHGQNPDKLDETEKLILAAGVPANRILRVLGSLENREVADRILSETINRFGKLNVLVNNAGTGGKPGVKDPFDLQHLDFFYEVNYRSIVQLSLAALPHLKKTNGNVLNISSVGGVRIVHPTHTFYSTMKAALDHWTRGFAQIAAPNVRVNSLNPGPIVTPIFERNNMKEEDLKKFESRTLLCRFGQPSEMSSIMKFLCSDEASYVTGAVLIADGGMALKTED